MPAMPPADLHAAMQWRCAVKAYDSTRSIPPDLWKSLEDLLVLSASSYGLQPYRFFVILDPAIRTKLKAAARGQTPVTDASHFVVFAIKKDLDAAYVERYVERIAEVRSMPVEALRRQRDTMIGDLVTGARHAWVDHWAARQTYLALGNFLTCAAVLGVDATPMEGFEPPKIDEILGLTAQGYAAVVCAAAGYRSSDDAYAKQPKVRFPADALIHHL